MPYIKKEDRPKFDGLVEKLVDVLQKEPMENVDGDLNYFITKVMKRVYPAKYFHYNRAVGMLECVKAEFQRRKIGPYEDTKIIENGDVD